MWAGFRLLIKGQNTLAPMLVLCVSFMWQMVKMCVTRLQMIEGTNAHDQIAFYAFYSFLVEAQINAVLLQPGDKDCWLLLSSTITFLFITINLKACVLFTWYYQHDLLTLYSQKALSLGSKMVLAWGNGYQVTKGRQALSNCVSSPTCPWNVRGEEAKGEPGSKLEAGGGIKLYSGNILQFCYQSLWSCKARRKPTVVSMW